MTIGVPELVELDDMRRDWWITFKWENVQDLNEEKPRYKRIGYRPIEEAKEAAENFDLTWKSRVSSEHGKRGE